MLRHEVLSGGTATVVGSQLLIFNCHIIIIRFLKKKSLSMVNKLHLIYSYLVMWRCIFILFKDFLILRLATEDSLWAKN